MVEMTWRGARRALAGVLIVGAVAMLARTAWYAVGPRTSATESAALSGQVRWLNRAIESGAPNRMQRLFPEGATFTIALTAIASGRAAARASGQDRDRLVADLKTRVAELESESVTKNFPRAGSLAHGVALTGWRLHARLALASATRSDDDIAAAVAEARSIIDALASTSSPFLESYTDMVWPVDTVVAVAAVAEVDREFGVPGAEAAIASWVPRARARSHDGLLMHRVYPIDDVTIIGGPDGPRGSSGALILAFLPDIDRDWADQAWRSFSAAYVTRTFGAVGIREFPEGSEHSGDIDSGPLIFGVSLSATAVGVAAARANGEVELARDLLRQGDIVGLPLQVGGERRYALGALPVGDAFVAWARSVPVAEGAAIDELPQAPRPLWWVWCLPWLILLAAGLMLLKMRSLWPRLKPGPRPQELGSSASESS